MGQETRDQRLQKLDQTTNILTFLTPNTPKA